MPLALVALPVLRSHKAIDLCSRSWPSDSKAGLRLAADGSGLGPRGDPLLRRAQMALGWCDFSRDKAERFATLCTAAIAVWNVGIAFLVGLGLRWLLARGYVRL